MHNQKDNYYGNYKRPEVKVKKEKYVVKVMTFIK